MKISGCMITKNEEANIRKSINSYKEIIDEIIVIDTGSTDDTVRIARELGAKVYNFVWENNFSSAKNYALSKANGDWIIFLDADEYFDTKKSKQIPNIIKKYAKDNIKLIGCKLINIDEKSGNQISTIVQVRIFKKEDFIYYVSPIHERLHSDKQNTKAIYLTEELEIYHTGYSYERINEKAKRNLEMLLKELDKKPIDYTLYHFLSDTYLSLKEYEECIYYGNLFLENKVNMVGLNSKVYQNMIAAMIKSKRGWKDIEEVIRKALTEFPTHPVFHMFLGERFFCEKYYEKALESYKTTLQMQLNYADIEINHLGEKIHEIEYAIARIYDYKNQGKKAMEYYISALTRKKDYIKAFDAILNISQTSDEINIINTLEKIYDKKNPKEVSFIIERLVKFRCKEALAFYVTWMYKEFNHQDFSLVVMFLTNKKYQQAFEHFYEAYILNFDNSYAKLALVSAYMSKNDEMLLKLKDIVKPSYKRIIIILLSEGKKGKLYKEDLGDYLDILKEIIKLEEDNLLDEYITLISTFEINILELETAIGNVLKDNRRYKKAIEHYIKAIHLNATKDKENKYLYYVIGYCYYKLGNYDKALVYFENALKNNYLGNNIREILNWIKQLVSDSKLKVDTQILIDTFNNTRKADE